MYIFCALIFNENGKSLKFRYSKLADLFGFANPNFHIEGNYKISKSKMFENSRNECYF